MGNKKKRAKGGLSKHKNQRKRGKTVTCSHYNRATGERCNNKVGATKSTLRPFCPLHKKQHNPRHKTRVIVDKNNRRLKKEKEK